MKNIVFLSLGGNHDNTNELLAISIEKISRFSSSVPEVSKYYITTPWGFEAENDFVNCVVKISTELEPLALLKEINAIEEELGRVRVGEGYASRPIDIDIIYFGDLVMATKKLTIPHPRMYDRNFVLVPLNDVASYWIDPIKNNTVSCLLKRCGDASDIAEY